jgi:hypothetical protein
MSVPLDSDKMAQLPARAGVMRAGTSRAAVATLDVDVNDERLVWTEVEPNETTVWTEVRS